MKRAALALVLVLAGCAPAEIRPSFTSLEFELTGRLAARYQSEAFTGNFAWKHAREADEMLISTSLGQGVARITRQGEDIVLATAEPREYRSTDAELITERILGFRVPLAGLADWVRARPSTQGAGASAAQAEYLPDGKLKSLEQSGWRIEYQDYDGPRPTRLRLLYPGIELRLAISQWK